MKTKCSLLALLFLAVTTFAYAGGPPPMYVVVQKVVLEPGKKVPGWIQIWGSFTREEATSGQGKSQAAFSKPAYGYVYLSISDYADRKFQDELRDWQQAAGTGKAVAVGSCGDGGSLLKSKIHPADVTVTKPDAVYIPGILRRFGDVYANGEFNGYPEVAALIKFTKERK